MGNSSIIITSGSTSLYLPDVFYLLPVSLLVISPVNPLYHGCICLYSCPFNSLLIFSIQSAGLKLGTSVDHPVPIPFPPLTSPIGMIGTNYTGSTICPSSSSYFKMYLSSSLKMYLVIADSFVKMYLELALSDPPISLVPN